MAGRSWSTTPTPGGRAARDDVAARAGAGVGPHAFGYGRSVVDDELRSYLGITRLQSAYADVVSRRAWEELDALFAPGCRIEVDTVTSPARHFAGGADFGAFVAESIERFEFFEFVILNTVVDIHPGPTATGRLWMAEPRQEWAR